MTGKTTLRIRTVDGEEHEFDIPTEDLNGAEYSVASRLEKLLTQRSIALALDDRLLIIPMEQIRSIELSPLRGKVPGTVPRVKPIWSSLAAGDMDLASEAAARADRLGSSGRIAG